MQIETLKLLCDAARLGNFSRAAEAHRVTQSTVSQAVQSLEHRLGRVLIDRSHRPWALTPAGKIFVDGCRDVVDRYEALERRLRGVPEEGDVRIAAIYSVGLRHMRQFAEGFAREHAGVRLHVDYLHPDKVLEAVRDERADIGIVSFPPRSREWQTSPWRKEPMVVACAPGHPFARLKSVDVARLAGESFVAFDRGLGIRREVDRFLKRHGVAVRASMEFDNIEAIKKAVEIGSGLSLLPSPALERETRAGTLAQVPLKKDRFVRPLGLVRRRGRPLSDAVRLVLDELRRDARLDDRPKMKR